MKLISLIVFAALLCTHLNAQIFVTRSGSVSFFSKTPLEDIKAVNNQAAAAIDVSKKNIVFNCLVKGFQFPKALMQEHFNENYVESDKYPQTTFTGSYTGDVDMNKEGAYPIIVTGELKLHGVAKKITVPAVLEVKNGDLIARTEFTVTPSDFNISVPSLVRDKIAERITIKLNSICKKR